MDGEYRPLPLSIIDFFGAIVPGIVWLILLMCLTEMVTSPDHVSTPYSAFLRLISAAGQGNTWVAPIVILLVAFAIGHGIKPLAMRAATLIALPLFRLNKRYRSERADRLMFPFAAIHENTDYYKKVCEIVTSYMRQDEGTVLPGPQPFSAAKRILRLYCTALWEESEHMEAEVRMIGGLVLGCAFSVVLAAVGIVWHAILKEPVFNDVEWLIGSIALAAAFGNGFNQARVREVGYTYLNLIIASRSESLRCAIEGQTS